MIAETLARDTSLLPDEEQHFDPPLRGMVPDEEVRRQADLLDNMDIDSYIEAVVTGAEDPKRVPAPEVIRGWAPLRPKIATGRSIRLWS